jgi:hypothetical protein
MSKLFSLLLSILITLSSLSPYYGDVTPIQKKARTISTETIRKNPKKMLSGMGSYWVGSFTSWAILSELNPYFIWYAFLLTPVTGAISSSIGVYLSGDMNGEASSFDKTVIGGIKGGLIGSWSWFVPIPIINPLVLGPATPTLYSIEAYNKVASPISKYQNKTASLSIDPFRYMLAMSRLINLSKGANTPLTLNLENSLKRSKTWYVETNYQNQTIDIENFDLFFGLLDADEEDDETDSWKRKCYSIKTGIRNYNRQSISGWYRGLGIETTYSSLASLSGELETSNIYTGKGIFIKPFIELGYRLDLTNKFFIESGFQVGPTISLETEGDHYKMWQEIPYESIEYLFLSNVKFRSGWKW